MGSASAACRAQRSRRPLAPPSPVLLLACPERRPTWAAHGGWAPSVVLALACRHAGEGCGAGEGGRRKEVRPWVAGLGELGSSAGPVGLAR